MRWTDEQATRLRDKMSLAKRQGTWLSAFEAEIVLGLIQFWMRVTRRTGSPSEGMLPTIADSKRHGITHIFVDCETLHCGHSRRLSFDDLKLPDETVFVEITRRRRFVCHRCRQRQGIGACRLADPENGAGLGTQALTGYAARGGR